MSRTAVVRDRRARAAAGSAGQAALLVLLYFLGLGLPFPAGTLGHPADKDVSLLVVDVADWSAARERIGLPGGQGTINVNSWAPDSRRFASVSYPTAG